MSSMCIAVKSPGRCLAVLKEGPIGGARPAALPSAPAHLPRPRQVTPKHFLCWPGPWQNLQMIQCGTNRPKVNDRIGIDTWIRRGWRHHGLDTEVLKFEAAGEQLDPVIRLGMAQLEHSGARFTKAQVSQPGAMQRDDHVGAVHDVRRLAYRQVFEEDDLKSVVYQQL